MKDFKFTKETQGAVDIFRIEGSLDMFSFHRLETALTNSFNEQRYHLLVNMEKLDYIGTSGLGAILQFRSQAVENHGNLKLVKVPNRIADIIRVLGFNKYFPTYNEESEALNAFTDEMKNANNATSSKFAATSDN